MRAPTDDETELLSIATIHSAKEFGLANKRIRAKVVDVYDGDTITLAFVFERTVYKKQCRVKGVDCAEIRSKNTEEKETGLRAKQRTTQLTYNTIIRAEFDKDEDKYGRLLAFVYLADGRRLDEVLIEEGLGYPYSGEHKQPFEQWHAAVRDRRK
jgi:micrococcal nuclease